MARTARLSSLANRFNVGINNCGNTILFLARLVANMMSDSATLPRFILSPFVSKSSPLPTISERSCVPTKPIVKNTKRAALFSSVITLEHANSACAAARLCFQCAEFRSISSQINSTKSFT